MARIYAVNPDHTVDYGVDFINGAAAVPDANTTLINWFIAKGYTVVPGSDTLSPWDYLPLEHLQTFAPYAGIDPAGMDKATLVGAIETALISLMKIEITAFDAIPNIAAGKAGAAIYADAAAVKAVLPDYVTATFTNGSKATVPVTAWADTDTYDAAVAASYTFTATLGPIPTPFALKSGVAATVEVVVAAA